MAYDILSCREQKSFLDPETGEIRPPEFKIEIIERGLKKLPDGGVLELVSTPTIKSLVPVPLGRQICLVKMSLYFNDRTGWTLSEKIQAVVKNDKK